MLFGRSVGRRAVTGVQGLGGFRDDARQSEVGHIESVAKIHQDVGGLQVTVDDALRVKIVQRGGDANADRKNFFRREGSNHQPVMQRPAGYIRRDQVPHRKDGTEVVKRENVWVGEPQKLAGLAFELAFAFRPLLGVADFVELDGDDAILGRVERRPDESLPAEADLLEQLVLQELVIRVEFTEPDGERSCHHGDIIQAVGL